MWSLAVFLVVGVCFAKIVPPSPLPLLERVPAATFFIALLSAADNPSLVLYSLACCFPYSALCLHGLVAQPFPAAREEGDQSGLSAVE
jgi:hypothetical protein